MTSENSSIYPDTDRVQAVQAYLESSVPTYVLQKAWNTGNSTDVVTRVIRHYQVTKGQAFGLEIIVRDAMQNMVLNGKLEGGIGPQTLRALHDRLGQIITNNETDNHPARNDLPIYFRLNLEKGRGEWYIPVEFALGSPSSLRLPNASLEVFEITGCEHKAIKHFQTRARRNSGRTK